MADLKKITTKHKLIMLDMVYNGLTPKEIDFKYGISASRLSIVRGSPLWRTEEEKLFEEMKKDVRKNIQGKMGDAVEALSDHVGQSYRTKDIDGNEVGVAVNKPELRIASAKELLDRGGIFKEEEKVPLIAVNMNTINMEIGEIRQRKEVLIEQLRKAGIDITAMDTSKEVKTLSG